MRVHEASDVVEDSILVRIADGGYIGSYHTPNTKRRGVRRVPVSDGDYCNMPKHVSGFASYIIMAESSCYACGGDLNLRPIYEHDTVWGYVCEFCERQMLAKDEHEDYGDITL